MTNNRTIMLGCFKVNTTALTFLYHCNNQVYLNNSFYYVDFLLYIILIISSTLCSDSYLRLPKNQNTVLDFWNKQKKITVTESIVK